MRFLAALFSVTLAGCSLFGTGSDGGATNPPSGQVGFGAPTLELTISGVRFGPAAPDAASAASLSTTHDASGQISGATFQLGISSSALGASCQLSIERFGTAIAGFNTGAYTLADPGPSGTADGTASPIGNITVTVPQGTFQCSGSDCDGMALVFSTLAADHVEGYASGTLQDSGGNGQAEVVCSFYAPMSSFTQ